MNTTNTVSNSTYSLSTLEDTPRRVLEFLRGVGASPTILSLMTQAGYTAHAHEEGQRLLSDVVAFVQEREAFNITTSAAHMAASNELDAWCKTEFRRLRAGVVRLFPDQVDALFANLELSNDTDAVLIAKIFLERVGELADSKGKKSAAAVIKMFEQRGFGPDDIRHLKKLVSVAEAPAPVHTDETDAAAIATAKRDTRIAMLVALRSWYDDWSATARAVLVRRDHQIRVGLAHRKARAVNKVVTPPPPPVSPEVPANDNTNQRTA